MTIVIPMAGESSRFVNEGYAPKYMLELKSGYTLFQAAVESFLDYFNTALFIFVTNSIDATNWVNTQISLLEEKYTPIRDYKIITLDHITQGQAETVYLGIKESLTEIYKHDHCVDKNNSYYSSYMYLKHQHLYGESLVIFNIDTIRHNFKQDLDTVFELPELHDLLNTVDSPAFFDAIYDVDVEENKWSFCKEIEPCLFSDAMFSHEISETAEKKRIGKWYSTGLYIFPTPQVYMYAYETACKSYDIITGSKEKYNFYIAPLYNVLIKYYKRRCFILPCDRINVEFAGVPKDYESLKAKYIN
jgi:hypothetical protein